MNSEQHAIRAILAMADLMLLIAAKAPETEWVPVALRMCDAKKAWEEAVAQEGWGVGSRGGGVVRIGTTVPKDLASEPIRSVVFDEVGRVVRSLHPHDAKPLEPTT